MKLLIRDIKIPERWRVDYGDLQALRESIDRLGLLQPVIVSGSGGGYILADGARRILACQQLGLEEIEVVLYENLDETTRREIELEANIRRKQFTWQEEVRAKAEFVELRRSRTSTLWGPAKVGKDVAESLCVTESELSQGTQLAGALVEYPELLQEESKTKAFKKYKQILQRKALEVISRAISVGEDLWLYNGDSAVELEKVPAESVGLVLTDPGWGVNAFDVYDSVLPQYDDSELEAFKTLSRVLPQIKRVMKGDSHAYFFFGTKHYIKSFNLLSQFFEVEEIPLIWVKPGAYNTAPQARFAVNYETIFFCRKGKRSLYKPSMAALPFPIPTDKIHPHQKPLELMEHLIEVSSIPGEVVLDPFAGSGVVGKAALKTKRKAILVEKDTDIFNAMKVYVCRREDETKTGAEET